MDFSFKAVCGRIPAAVSFARNISAGHDSSHDWENHIAHVVCWSVRLLLAARKDLVLAATGGSSQARRQLELMVRITAAAASLHETFDHKYADAAWDAQTERAILAALGADSFSTKEGMTVLWIVRHIGYSKQKHLRRHELAAYPPIPFQGLTREETEDTILPVPFARECWSYVNDADLGLAIDLARCVDFACVRAGARVPTEKIAREVLDHFQSKLARIHGEGYLRTPEAVRLFAVQHQTMLVDAQNLAQQFGLGLVHTQPLS